MVQILQQSNDYKQHKLLEIQLNLHKVSKLFVWRGMIKLDELFSSTTVTVCNNMPSTIQG